MKPLFVILFLMLMATCCPQAKRGVGCPAQNDLRDDLLPHVVGISKIFGPLVERARKCHADSIQIPILCPDTLWMARALHSALNENEKKDLGQFLHGAVVLMLYDARRAESDRAEVVYFGVRVRHLCGRPHADTVLTIGTWRKGMDGHGGSYKLTTIGSSLQVGEPVEFWIE